MFTSQHMRLFSQELLLQSYSTATTVSTTTMINATSTSTGNHHHHHCHHHNNNNNIHHHPSTLPLLPSALRSLFVRAGRVMESVLSRVPRIVLYIPRSTTPSSVVGASAVITSSSSPSLLLPSSSSSSSLLSPSSSSSSAIARQACKCMLMSNGLNFPDLRVLWKDGTKLKYSLKTGTQRNAVVLNPPFI